MSAWYLCSFLFSFVVIYYVHLQIHSMAIAISTYTLSKGESQKVIRRWKQKDGPWDDAIFLFVFFFFKILTFFFPIRLLIDIHNNVGGPPPLPTSTHLWHYLTSRPLMCYKSGYHHHPDTSQATSTRRNDGSSNSSRRGSRYVPSRSPATWCFISFPSILFKSCLRKDSHYTNEY